MSKPLISVIVPVYNAEKYLQKCIYSILNQTYQNLEVILIDDGSTDGSGQLCDELSKKDRRIRVIHQQNQGQSAARNTGLDLISGQYVGFVDSDDWIEPEMFSILYNRLINENAQISCCGTAEYKNGKIVSYFNSNLKENFTLSNAEAEKELIYNYRITNSLWDKLFHANIFTNLRLKLGMIYEDFEIMPKCINAANKITYTSQPLYCYNLSDNSTIRGTFSIKQYDLIQNSLNRIQYFKANFPEYVNLVQAAHYEFLLNTVYKSTGIDEWKVLRSQIINEIKGSIPPHTKKSLSRKTKIKIALLKINPNLYAKIMNYYYKNKK